MRWIVVILLVAGVAILIWANSIDPLTFSGWIYSFFPSYSSPNLSSPLASARQGAFVKEAMQVLLSLILLAASVFVILAKRFGPKDKHWAYGTVGTLIGFWLKSN